MIRKTQNSMHNQSKFEHGASTSLHIVELAQKSLHKLQVTGRSGCIWRHGCFMPSNKQKRTESFQLGVDTLDFRAQTGRRTPGRNRSMQDKFRPAAKRSECAD